MRLRRHKYDVWSRVSGEAPNNPTRPQITSPNLNSIKILRCNPDVNVIKLNAKKENNGCNHLRAGGKPRGVDLEGGGVNTLSDLDGRTCAI